MKKSLAMIFSIIFLFSAIFTTPIQAEVYRGDSGSSAATASFSEISLSEYFAPYYFSNLIENIGNNEKGSCSQVATAMLLSYYDTYWDDSIIPEFYDEVVSMSSNSFGWEIAPSPGVKKESDNGFSDGSTVAEIASVYQALSEIGYFHSYLVDLGIDSNFHIETAKSLGLSSVEQNQLTAMYLTEYLSDELSIFYVDEGEFSAEATTSIRNYTIQLLQAGIPVAMGIFERVTDAQGVTKYPGHVVVAHDYDAVTDTIYVHTGWYSSTDNNSHVDIETLKYTLYRDCLAIIPTMDWEHSCSDNYQYTDSSGVTTSHCPCESHLHPAHTHDSYTSYTTTAHAYSCATCGTSGSAEEHYYRTFGRNPGASMGSTHRAYCPCGYYRVEYHVVRASADGSSFPAPCIYCGLLATDGDLILMNIPGELELMGVQSTPGSYTLSDGTTIRILTENGSYVLPSGIIVLSEADAALVDAGLLDPYALVESSTIPSNPGHVTE